MATLEKIRLSPLEETDQAKAFAARYRCEFVDLREALEQLGIQRHRHLAYTPAANGTMVKSGLL